MSQAAPLTSEFRPSGFGTKVPVLAMIVTLTHRYTHLHVNLHVNLLHVKKENLNERVRRGAQSDSHPPSLIIPYPPLAVTFLIGMRDADASAGQGETQSY